MRVVRFSSAEEFLARTAAHLEEAEAENGLVLGVALRLVSDAKAADREPYLAAVIESSGALLGAAVRTPPWPLALTRVGADAASALVADLAGGSDLTAVNGPREAAEEFARLWVEARGGTSRTARQLRVHRLDRVASLPPCPGRLRAAADEDDLDILETWSREFVAEAGLPAHGDLTRAAKAAIDERRAYFWDDGLPVSMATWSRPTRRGVSINMVYTPPMVRGRGYATACVAALSAKLLAEGRDFCSLFTDLGNPTSNRIYRRIGYQPVADFAEIDLLPEEPAAGRSS